MPAFLKTRRVLVLGGVAVVAATRYQSGSK
jgi:hypothetical protein